MSAKDQHFQIKKHQIFFLHLRRKRFSSRIANAFITKTRNSKREPNEIAINAVMLCCYFLQKYNNSFYFELDLIVKIETYFF